MTLDELRELRDVTERCMEQARIAQQNAAKYIEHYRVQAEKFKTQADTTSPDVRARFLRVAASHERLIELAESREVSTEISYGSSDDRALPMDRAHIASVSAGREEDERVRHRVPEDPIVQGRRHVAEAERHIARQEALIVKLSKNDRYAALAAEATEILATLKQTLNLALQHLDMELKK